MERTCEFCVARKATVLCGADKAYLCLSCDAKVHSANALSERHFRCLLCECCGDESAHFRCLDHRMLLCRACNRTLHCSNPKHQKRMVSSFTGSPSAKEFAILWGFQVDWSNVEDSLAASSASFQVEPTKQSHMIMQQILDLKRLQMSGVNIQSSAIREREKSHSSSSCIYNNLDVIDVCPQDGSTDDFQGLKEQHFDSPLSQSSEYLFSYVSSDPFWQSGTALEINKQYWPQNMEDERISEEFKCLDDLKMPEVDMAFPNFEELIREDLDLSRALLEDNSSAHKSQINNAQFKAAGGNNTIGTSKRQCKTRQEGQRSGSITRR